MALGRILLGPVTDRFGTGRSVFCYLLCAFVVQTLFCIFAQPVPAVLLVSVLGFFCGPLYPSCMVELAALLPKSAHVAAISLVASVAQAVGGLLPFALGLLSARLGIGIYPFMVLVQLLTCAAMWVPFHRLRSLQD
jgi:MFS family permease